MPPGDDPIEPVTTPVETPPADPPAAPVAAAVALTPEQVRNSPEYRELARQNQLLARTSGQNERVARLAREEAERTRLAAEARAQQDLETQLAATLGEDGLAAYNEIAQLSQSDPTAAAKRIAELVAQARGQTPPAVQPGAAPPAPDTGGNVPPAPSAPRGLSADAPLGQPPVTQDEYAAAAEVLDREYNDIVARVQDPQLRRRVTTADRAKAFIGFLGSSYLRGGARPRS
jgi:hypothetical protein